MFTANWTEKDEAVLVELLRRKIREMKYDMKDCTSPYAKRSLKKKRTEYQILLSKVESGQYDPNVLANELRTYSTYKDRKLDKKSKKLGRYADAYTDVDFDYEAYFSKTRYFGASLPLIMLVLMLVFLALILSSMFIPHSSLVKLEDNMSSDEMRISIGSVAYFKLGEGENDFSIPNNGKWPKGTFRFKEQKLEQDEVYRDEVTGAAPERVLLYTEAGMSTIDLTIVDIMKASFRTRALADKEITPIENLETIDTPSWYHIMYIRDRRDELKIKKNEDGKYDNVAALRTVATYGTMVSLIAMAILCILEVIFNIARLFSYTSRRVHAIPILILILGVAAMLFPALLEIKEASGPAVGEAFRNYFQTDWQAFLENSSANICFNLIFPILLILPALTSVLPLAFKNKAAKTVAYVPKGNRPHTYSGQSKPTRPGKPGMKKAPKEGKVARAGSKPAYNPRMPAR